MTAPDIFLSYNREDQAVAKRYADAFAAEGLNVWWDTALRSGEAYDEVTEAALRAAKAVVVLWSPRSVVSRWVRAEATIADRCKTLVPVTIEPCERPIMFELTQTAELSHWTGDAGDAAWLGFVDDVRRVVGREAPQAGHAPKPVAVASEPILAVLPFDNQSNDADMQFFSDGVSEEILLRLSRGAQIKIIGRTSSFQFRGERKAEAASLLKCSHILDGSVRRSGERARISAHLAETSTKTTLWSDRYDRTLDDTFAVQDEIAEQIATALDRAFISFSTKPADSEVYDRYLRASPETFRTDEMKQKIMLLEPALERQPDFAEGWGRLAYLRAFAHFSDPYRDRPGIIARANAEADRALSADPLNAEALVAKFLLVPPFGSYLEADALIERIQAISGYDSIKFFVGAFLVCVGRVREASLLNDSLFETDPLNGFFCHRAAVGKMSLGQYDAAIRLYEGLIARSPDMHFIFWTMVRAYALKGDWAKLDQLMSPEMLARHPVAGFEETARLAELLRARNQGTLDRAQALEGLQMNSGSGADSAQLAYAAHLGLVDEALERGLNARHGPVGDSSDVMGVDAYRPALLFWYGLPELRSDPRFIAYAARLGLVEYWLATQKWPDCADETPYDFRAECEKYRDTSKDPFFA